MPKRSGALALMLPPRTGKVAAYRWLYDAVRAAILDGRLRPGGRLPATRDMARQYGLSRGTVVSAFDQLRSEGYVEGSVGSGTYVRAILPDDLLHVSQRAARVSTVSRAPARVLSGYARRVKYFGGYDPIATRAFRANLPAVDLFPTALWTQITARLTRRATARMLMGGAAMGYDPLREAVASYLSTSRGVRCGPHQITIVSGVQEAVEVAARMFVDPGDTVCMEDPGYVGATRVFESLGARIHGVRVDDSGMRVPGSRAKHARMVYLTPAHQFPLGTTMTLPRRLELLEWARRTGAVLFEDDYDSEFRYSGRPVPALQGLDRSGQVLFAGSFSKVLFPSLRLGYLVVPEDLVDVVAAVKSVTTHHAAPLLEQAVLSDFMSEGHFARHVRRMREVYAQRLGALLHESDARLRGLLEISNVEAGLQTVAWLPDGLSAERVYAGAAKRDVQVVPISRYGKRKLAREGLQLGFAAVDEQEIRRGVRQLAIVLEREMKQQMSS